MILKTRGEWLQEIPALCVHYLCCFQIRKQSHCWCGGQKHRFYDEFVPLWGFVSCVTQINKSITGFNGALAVALCDGLPLIPLL